MDCDESVKKIYEKLEFQLINEKRRLITQVGFKFKRFKYTNNNASNNPFCPLSYLFFHCINSFYFKEKRKAKEAKKKMEIELSEKENSLQESLQKQTEMAKKLSNIYLMEFEQKKQNEKLLKVNQFSIVFLISPFKN